VQKNKKAMQIFIKTYTGKRPVLEVELDSSVKDVKKQVWEKEGIPPEQQLLWFAGKQLLDDAQQLSFYDIHSEATLELEPSQRSLRITVQRLSGGSDEIEALSTDTTADLKERIRKSLNIPEADQKLVFQNLLLEDQAKPFEVLCEFEYIIQLCITRTVLLEIKTLAGSLGSFTMNVGDTLGRLKDIIQEQHGIAEDRQLLCYKGKQLVEDDRTIGDHKFEGPLYLVERQAIEVTVKLLTGQNFPLEICTSKTIGDVKKRIQQLEGLAVEGQRLIFGGHQLKDEAKVNEYKIEAGNTIHLVMRTAVASTSSTSSPGTIGTCESRGACGLFNMGNTCYLNSTLQALSNTRALRQYYDEGHYKADISTSPESMGGRLADGFANLLRSLWDGGYRAVNPSKLRELINEKWQQFAGYRQHDAQELLMFFLDGLHEDVNRKPPKNAVNNVFPEPVVLAGEPSKVAKFAPDESLNSSKIMDIFQFQVRSEITFEDLADEDLHHKFEAMVYLSLPIRTEAGPSIGSKSSRLSSPEVNLLHCLEQFANHEELAQDDWAYCERTRRCERSSVKMDIWSAPECLIIHLKRFAVDATTGDTEKIDTFVQFPLDLDLAPFVVGPSSTSAQYRLYAVVNHSGTLSYGHYTAYCKVGGTEADENSRRWYHFNDATVLPVVNESEIVSREAYLLFYERV